MSLQIAIVKQATLFGEAFETGAVTQKPAPRKKDSPGGDHGLGAVDILQTRTEFTAVRIGSLR